MTSPILHTLSKLITDVFIPITSYRVLRWFTQPSCAKKLIGKDHKRSNHESRATHKCEKALWEVLLEDSCRCSWSVCYCTILLEPSLLHPTHYKKVQEHCMFVHKMPFWLQIEYVIASILSDDLMGLVHRLVTLVVCLTVVPHVNLISGPRKRPTKLN